MIIACMNAYTCMNEGYIVGQAWKGITTGLVLMDANYSMLKVKINVIFSSPYNYSIASLFAKKILVWTNYIQNSLFGCF